MGNKSLITVLFLLSLFSSLSFAGWNHEHERGWHWYESREEESLAKKEPTKTGVPSEPPVSYAQELKNYRKNGEELRAKAILQRTPESVASLMEWEKKMWDNSERFGDVWEAVLRLRPDLDYSVTHPTTQYARQVYLDEQKKEVKGALAKLRTEYGLVFFFKGTCPYCHSMAPIVSSVAQHHGLNLKGVSLDGGTLQTFTTVYPDNGLSAHFKVTMVPALYAVNPLSGDYFPIATGAISQQDLEERIYQIAQYQAYDIKGLQDGQ